MKTILGSSSEWRQKLMGRIVPDFEVVTPDIDEKAIRRDDPGELVEAIAAAKSTAVQEKRQEAGDGQPAIVVTSDQVVVFNSEIREKPESESQAREWIAEAHLHPAETWTGMHVVNTETGQVAAGVDVAKVWFKPIPQDVADHIISQGYWNRTSGGFDVDDPAAKEYVLKRQGDLDSVMGLPLELTKRLIGEVSND